ncbi:hypothetical protein ACG33_07335 [Steroidobacter denitrificans]|uniref:Uncharacterized protein n=1 Tax=Steroidobacter denitrificans TaxID=465721 RepID=A0A127FBD4_STEDE|nr:hypothetical protein ACG33_07335 [Steroidobacter denitrificans]
MQNPQDQGAVLEGLKENDVVAVRTAAQLRAELGASYVVERPVCDLLAVFADFADERDCTSRIVEHDVVADLFKVGFGQWREIGAHLLFRLLGGFGVFALKTVENVSSRPGFPTLSAFVDFTAQGVERCLSPLLLLLQQTQSIPQDFACADVAASIDLPPYELLEVFTEGVT